MPFARAIHPLLSKKVCLCSSKISANALLAKALSVRKSQAGLLLVTIRAVEKNIFKYFLL